MAKRLDAKALKGAFARGKTKRNLDFLVPDKDAAAEPAAEAPPPPAELGQSGPQRRKQAASKRTTAKRSAAKRKVSQRAPKAKAASERKAPAPAQTEAPAPQATTTPPVDAPLPTPQTVSAPDARGTRVVHDVATAALHAAELQAVEAELALHALYDGWAPATPRPRAGLLRRLRARLRRVCEGLIGTAVNGVLSQPTR